MFEYTCPNCRQTVEGITMRKLLLLALFCVSGCGGASSSPGETVKAVLEAANAGKYSEANEGLGGAARKVFGDVANSKQYWDLATVKGTITKIEIKKEEVRGEGATVQYVVHYKIGGKARGKG